MASFAEIRNPNTEIHLADNVMLGKNVVLGRGCRRIEIGFGTFLGNDIYIDVEYLKIGDYVTVHHGSVLHGIKTEIGHNCWIGQYTIVDSLGGDTRLGNNVGVGAHSQLWSHMKFGDMLQGCRWNSCGSLHLDDDVWLVGHSIVGPIHAHRKSMLMTGSVAVKDMQENRIYAGSPAKDCSDKFGMQFEEVSHAEKVRRFESLRKEFCESHSVSPDRFQLVEQFAPNGSVTQFNIRDRTYLPTRDPIEVAFIRFMLYEKAKWIPVENL